MRSIRHAEHELGHFATRRGLLGARAIEAGNPHAQRPGLWIDDRFRRSGSRVDPHGDTIHKLHPVLAERFGQPIRYGYLMRRAHRGRTAPWSVVSSACRPITTSGESPVINESWSGSMS
jgi:hypothetical protein